MTHNWNMVFDKIIEIKNEYINTFGINENLYNKEEFSSCVKKWILNLEIEEYTKLFEKIQINQFENMILIRYGKYDKIFNGEEDLDYNNKYDSFWYKNNGFYSECRSLVVDVEKEFIVLCPFKKFRNINECEENKIENVIEEIKNAKTVEITNKLDGSMQSARYVKEYDKIVISGSQSLDINQSWRLSDGYNMLISNSNYVKMLKENPNKTFIFEYISLKDQHCVVYNENQQGMYLIGIRDVLNGVQSEYNDVLGIANRYSVLSTEMFDKTIYDVLDDVKKYKSNEREGYVLNIDGRMLKIKVDDYIKIHKVLSQISSINLIIQHIADNKFDDLISKIPNSYQKRVYKIANIVYDYINDCENKVNYYYKLAPKNDRKEFMVWVNKNVDKKYITFLISKYNNKEYNFLKSHLNSKTPRYISMKEIIGNSDYSKLFVGE